MKVTVKVEGVQAGHEAFVQQVDGQSGDPVKFDNGAADLRICGEGETNSCAIDVLEGCDLLVFEWRDPTADAQDAYLRTGAKD